MVIFICECIDISSFYDLIKQTQPITLNLQSKKIKTNMLNKKKDN